MYYSKNSIARSCFYNANSSRVSVLNLHFSVEIANSFNQYFTDIGPSLANQSDSYRHLWDYLRTPSVDQLALRSIDENIISQVIEHLKNKSSSGVEGISNNLIKMARCELVKR